MALKTIDGEHSLRQSLADIEKNFGDIISHGTKDLPEPDNLSLVSPMANFCLYNKFPSGYMYEFCGTESSGKTSSSYIVAGSFQRIERERENPRKILFVDVESTLDKGWALNFGYDIDDPVVETLVLRPNGQSAEKIFDIIMSLVTSGEIGFVILDSISTLTSEQLSGESFEKKEFGGIAKPLTAFTSRMIGPIKKYNCTIIFINQVRQNMSMYGSPWVTGGGQALKHNCVVRLMFSRGKFFDEDGNELTNSAENPVGHTVKIAVLKNKISRHDRKLGSYKLNYTKGIDVLGDTVECALHFGLIDNSVQGTFKIIDPETGEVKLDSEGNELKIRGKKNVRTYFEEHLDDYNKLYGAVLKAIELDESPYIKAFETMMMDSLKKGSEDILEAMDNGEEI